jgi:hypothetical protein
MLGCWEGLRSFLTHYLGGVRLAGDGPGGDGGGDAPLPAAGAEPGAGRVSQLTVASASASPPIGLKERCSVGRLARGLLPTCVPATCPLHRIERIAVHATYLSYATTECGWDCDRAVREESPMLYPRCPTMCAVARRVVVPALSASPLRTRPAIMGRPLLERALSRRQLLRAAPVSPSCCNRYSRGSRRSASVSQRRPNRSLRPLRWSTAGRCSLSCLFRQ